MKTFCKAQSVFEYFLVLALFASLLVVATKRNGFSSKIMTEAESFRDSIGNNISTQPDSKANPGW